MPEKATIPAAKSATLNRPGLDVPHTVPIEGPVADSIRRPKMAAMVEAVNSALKKAFDNSMGAQV